MMLNKRENQQIMKSIIVAIMALATTTFAEDKIGLNTTDTVVSVLKRQSGQRVEIRMKSGEKLAGKVENFTDKAVHLSALTGQEFYDAVVALDDISAVIIRTGGK
jgi:hypothetical protein